MREAQASPFFGLCAQNSANRILAKTRGAAPPTPHPPGRAWRYLICRTFGTVPFFVSCEAELITLSGPFIKFDSKRSDHINYEEIRRQHQVTGPPGRLYASGH